ncbi:MAG: TIGR01212 family radical SAM protein [Gammaproteobacteria bacterium]|nr:TIGR01212 family radical SAM protein [Gammaproteobacteria bacterium]
MFLPGVVHSFGQAMLEKYGEKVHKLALNAAFTCPNRDGSKGRGGCSFCNNRSFNPNTNKPPNIQLQIDSGKQVILKRTGARKYLAYFQAYTNTYADIASLKQLYESALQVKNVIGLSVGTRPDCVPDKVLALLADYQQQGHEVWLELGLQSAFDETLQRVNRGHGFAEYRDAVKRARQYHLKVCTHLIIGLPGETVSQSVISHQRVMDLGTEGLKLHPLHVVKGTQLANEWRKGEYQPLGFKEYVLTASEIIKNTPLEVVFHRLTATAREKILLAPAWCGKKWQVLNAIHDQLITDQAWQGSALN